MLSNVKLAFGKIESLKIKLDKKYKFKAKGIVVSYKQVKNIGEIIIVDKNLVIEDLKKIKY